VRDDCIHIAEANGKIAPARMVKIALDVYPALSDGRSWKEMQIPIVIDLDIT